MTRSDKRYNNAFNNNYDKVYHRDGARTHPLLNRSASLCSAAAFPLRAAASCCSNDAMRACRTAVEGGGGAGAAPTATDPANDKKEEEAPARPPPLRSN